jgi:hypothetical protein
VERRAAAGLPYRDFVRDYVVPGRPVVISGGVDGWPALKKWTPDFFRTQHGERKVYVTRETEPMRFADLVDKVVQSTEASPAPYLHRVFICDHLPELLADLLPGNPYSFPRRMASPLMPKVWRRPDGWLKLLFGGVGGRFPVMHYDGANMHAAITEILGEKEFILFPPEDAAYVYPRPDNAQVSAVEEVANPDYVRHPLLAKATEHRCVIGPGDTIFVPARWWHTTRILSVSISVCQNMLDETNWDGFVDEACRFSRSDARRRVKRASLLALGRTFDALEAGARIPGLGAAARTLAPVDSTCYPDLRAFKVDASDGPPPY